MADVIQRARDCRSVYQSQASSHFDQHQTNPAIAKAMVSPPEQDAPSFHFILCIDESGLMAAQSQEDFNIAFDNIVASRKTKECNDFISVVQFSDTARCTVSYVESSKCGRFSWVGGGTTDFLPALTLAAAEVKKTPDHVTPIIVFLTAGEPVDKVPDAISATSKFYNEIVVPSRGESQQAVEFNGIFFGSGGCENMLKKLCFQCKGTFMVARNRNELESALGSIGNYGLSLKWYPTGLGLDFQMQVTVANMSAVNLNGAEVHTNDICFFYYYYFVSLLLLLLLYL